MARTLSKQYVAADVVQMARERIRHCYDVFDRVAVSFSGGKDSTIILNLALEVARERGRLPLDVVFFDEEAIPPETVDYVYRVMRLPDISLRWFCLPVKHRNGCSGKSPFWRPFDPACPELWCRQPPEWAITSLPGFQGESIPTMNHLLFDPAQGSVGILLGLRAQESLNRFRSVAHKERDNYISWEENGFTAKCKPIYDWQTEDVWLAPHRFGWDYNRAYDRMEQMGLPRREQRVAPPFGEEPMRNLHTFQVCWPELWDKMNRRVPGAATAARYATTSLYHFGQGNLQKLEGMSWKEMIEIYLQRHSPEVRSKTAHRIRKFIRFHEKRGVGPIPDQRPCPYSGVSWKFLATIACRGDVKGRRSVQYGWKEKGLAPPPNVRLLEAMRTRKAAAR
jgi:predicted phosphoadenosine phosphosulfate sulfurtransferase